MPTAAEEKAFLKPILAAYADDGPRLIYADYLDESSRPADIARAEFIRLQIALARIGSDHPLRRTLVRRQNELLLRWQADWTQHLRGLFAGCEFRRGILDTVAVDAKFFCEEGARLFQHTAVRRVKFLDAAKRIERLAQCPALVHIRELDLCGNDLGNGGVNLLIRSPHLSDLESLDLSFNGIGDGGVRALARASAFPNLKILHLNDNRTIGCDGVRALAESAQLADLRTLDLSGNTVGDDGVRCLVRSAELGRLNRVRLHANRIGDGGIEALAASDLLGRMLAHDDALDLRDNAIGPPGAKALADSATMIAARMLDLGGNDIRDVGVRLLAESEFLECVHTLRLRQNRIGDPGAKALAHSQLMAQLAHLDVSSNRITPRGVELLWANRRDFRTSVESLGQFGFSTAHDGASG